MLTLTAAAFWWFQAQTQTQIESGFLQYGAIGLVALVALAAGVRLFTRQIQMHERDIARADRAEEELSKLNELIRDRLIVQLTQTADAVSRAAEVMAELRHDERRGSR